MILATYNVMSGGFTTYGSTATAPERLPVLQQTISILAADVVGLTDTFRWVDLFTGEQVAAMFGYHAAVHIDLEDPRVDPRIGVCLLSRLPIEDAKTVRAHNRNVLVADIRLGYGGLVTVAVAYLDDLSEDTRAAQADALIRALPDDRPVVLMGDLNTILPGDASQVNAAIKGIPRDRSREASDALTEWAAGASRAEVFRLLTGAGFACPASSQSTAMTPIHPWGLPRAVLPVDHIVARGAAVDARKVMTGGMFEVASDHYPMVAVLRGEGAIR